MRFRFYALWLSLVCIIVFLIQISVPEFTDLFVLNQRSYIEIWRFITAIFLHGGVAHLTYNLFALILFGSILERLVGGRNFLITFFLTGIGANIIAIFFYPSSLGASGAIFGIIGALILIRPSLMVFAFGIPMPIFIAGLVWAAGDIIGIFFPSGVGNIAHLSGLFLGLIIGSLYRDWDARKDRKAYYELDERYMRSWEDRYIR